MNELTTADAGAPVPAITDREMVSTANLILQPEAFARLEKFATMMAKGSATVPVHLRGNVGDCMAVTIQAMQWGMNPFAVAQKTHLIKGTLGYEGQLVNAAIQTMAPTKDRLHYEWFGAWEKIVGKFKTVESQKQKEDDGSAKSYRVPNWKDADEEGLGIKVWATLKGEDEPRELVLLMTQARTRNSTLWADDPKQQLAYLAIKRWSRLFCPDVILGVYTPDELDTAPIPKNMGNADVVGKPAGVSEEEMVIWRDVARKGRAAARAHWSGATQKFRDAATEEQKQDAWAIAVAADQARTVDNGADVPGSFAKTVDGPQTSDQPASTDDFVQAMERAEKQRAGTPE